jgi:hypothetical protein
MTTAIRPTVFRLMLFAAAWTAVVGWATAQAQSQAQSQAPAAPPATIQVANAGKRAIVAVYVSPPGRDDWSADMLGKQTLEAGGSVELKMPGKVAGCRLDFSALLDNGDTRTRGGVNVCAVEPKVGF